MIVESETYQPKTLTVNVRELPSCMSEAHELAASYLAMTPETRIAWLMTNTKEKT